MWEAIVLALSKCKYWPHTLPYEPQEYIPYKYIIYINNTSWIINPFPYTPKYPIYYLKNILNSSSQLWDPLYNMIIYYIIDALSKCKYGNPCEE